MSRCRPNAGERRELEFSCDRCGASPGEWCSVFRAGLYIQPSGRPAAYLHASRFYAATDAGLLPLPVGAS